MLWVQRGSELLKEVRFEFVKVSWPTRKELQSNTGVVIAAVIIISLFVGIIDRILSAGLGLIFH